MTLLSLAQNTADDLGVNPPATFIGNTNDRNAVRILRAAQRAGKQLARDAWKVLHKLHTITLVDADEAYALPSDYDVLANQTWWDRTNTWELGGPTSAQRWRVFKEGITKREREASDDAFAHLMLISAARFGHFFKVDISCGFAQFVDVRVEDAELFLLIL